MPLAKVYCAVKSYTQHINEGLVLMLSLFTLPVFVPSLHGNWRPFAPLLLQVELEPDTGYHDYFPFLRVTFELLPHY